VVAEQHLLVGIRRGGRLPRPGQTNNVTNQKRVRGSVGVCASCGRVLEFAGHVNPDLDLRVHREKDGRRAAGVLYRRAKRADLVQFDRESEPR
jgi:hypothetical protein